MKKVMCLRKTAVAGVIMILTLMFTACGNGAGSSNGSFHSSNEYIKWADKADIPEDLKISVGTTGNVYYSSGITDNPDYTTVLIVTFNDTTEADYNTLMEHYQSTSTGIEEDGSLLFNWGRLQVAAKDGSIQVNAFIR